MKRIAMVIAALALMATGRAFAVDEKSEVKAEHKADRSGSETTVERSSKDAAGSRDAKSEVKHKVTKGGKTETKKHVKRSARAPGKMRAKKSETKEKTVRDANGNVIEHQQKSDK